MLPPANRFGPLEDAARGVIPTLYGADAREGSLFESVFHDVPLTGALLSIPGSRLAHSVLSTVAPTRDLTLVQLSGPGLTRLRLRPSQLTDTDADEYAATRAWALALYRQTECDGLSWVSRRDNDAHALVLFGTRVSSGDLRVVSGPTSLFTPPGLDWVLAAANSAKITVIW